MTYPIIFFKGHVLLSLDSHLMLIDTGSPTTFHTGSSLELCNRVFEIENLWKQLGVCVNCLSAKLELPITTLLGMDILSQFELVIDYANGSISLYDGEPPTGHFSSEEIHCLPLAFRNQIPVTSIEVAGKQLPAFLHTGAMYSYVPETVTTDLEVMGRVKDFYPLYGCFSTLLYELPTSLAKGDSFLVSYGNLPATLAPMMPLVGANSILGYDFFRQHKVWLSPSRGHMYFQRVEVSLEVV